MRMRRTGHPLCSFLPDDDDDDDGNGNDNDECMHMVFPLLLLVQSFNGVGKGKRNGRSVFSGEIELEFESVCQSICRGGMLVGGIASWVVDQEVYLLFMGFVFCVWVWGETERQEGNSTRQTLEFSRLFAGIHLLGGARDHR